MNWSGPNSKDCKAYPKRPKTKALMKEITSEGGDPTSFSKGVLVYVLPFIV